MSEEYPLDLRGLAEVDAPEVVRGALRRFRRRLLGTGAVVLLAALSLVGGILWAVALNRTLAEQIDEAPGAFVGAVYERDGITTVLKRAARLDDGLGLSLLLAAPDSRATDNFFYRIDGLRNFDEAGGTSAQEFYLLVPPPEDGRVEVSLRLQRDCNPPGKGFCRAESRRVTDFTVDLIRLGVPEDIWRGN